MNLLKKKKNWRNHYFTYILIQMNVNFKYLENNQFAIHIFIVRNMKFTIEHISKIDQYNLYLYFIEKY